MQAYVKASARPASYTATPISTATETTARIRILFIAFLLTSSMGCSQLRRLPDLVARERMIAAEADVEADAELLVRHHSHVRGDRAGVRPRRRVPAEAGAGRLVPLDDPRDAGGDREGL